MTIGSLSARVDSGASVSQKLLSILLACVLAISLVPSAAWASDVEETQSAAKVTDGVADEATDETTEPVVDAEVKLDAPTEPEEATTEPSQDVTPEGDVSSIEPANEELASDQGAAEDRPKDVFRSAPAASKPVDDSGEASPLSLYYDSYVLIQNAKDKDSYRDSLVGELEIGATMWANAYDYDNDESIAAEPTWTYQWLASDSQDASDSSYVPIAGQTAQSLVLTEDLVSGADLYGKYIRVKVTGNGETIYGPTSAWTNPDTPGPIVKPGTINLSWAHVVATAAELTSNASSINDVKYAYAGTTLYAGAWKTGAATTLLGTSDGVSFSWQMAGEDGVFSEVGSGDSFTVPEGSAGKSLRVVANGGSADKITGIVNIVQEGAAELKSVSIDKPASFETGSTLTAHAFAPGASSWVTGPEVTEGVTYVWKYCKGTGSSSSTWTTVEGVSSNSLTVTDDYAGCSFIVEATAGLNTVSLSPYSAVGPFKKAGTYEIYSATYLNGETTSNNFKVGDTISIRATEKVAGSSSHPEIPADKLSVTWLASSEKGGTYTPIEGENAHKASFVIPAELKGLFLKCTVNAGVNDYTRSATNSIAPADAVKVDHLGLSGASATDAVAPGDTLTVNAFDAAGADITNKLSGWSWYTATTSYGSNLTPIEGAAGTSFTVPKSDSSYVGKYLVVKVADDYGLTSDATSSKVSVPGSIELYRVEASGTPQVGATLSATAYKVNQYNASVPTESTDTVLYQWQYATSNTTSESAFKDIPGATGKTYVVDASLADGTSLVGTYLRVRAISDNGVVSTQKPYYGTSQPVNPLGPVTQAGVYKLSSVKLAAFSSTMGDGQGFQVGNTVVPQAMVASGSYSEAPAPVDAKLSYTWYVSDTADSNGRKLESGYDPADGRLKLTDDLKGSYLRVTASALDNEVSTSDNSYGDRIANYLVVGADEYELLRVTVSPSSGDVFTGDMLSATVQARKLNSGTGVGTTGELLSRFEGISWYVGDSVNGPFVPIDGATKLNLVVPFSAADRYVKAVATSGTSSVERILESPIIGTETLESAAQKLSAESFSPNPVYGTADNVNALVKAELERLGYQGINVVTTEAQTNVDAEPNARVGVSSANDATNGAVTFFYLDPDKRATSLNYSALRQVKLSFTLTRDAETYDTNTTYAPTVVVPWDEGAASELLEGRSQGLAIGFSDGESAEAVTRNVTLPYVLRDATGAEYSWSRVTWTSSNEDALRVTQQGYFQDYQGVVTRTAEDQTVDLTATVGVVTSGGPETTVQIPFKVTIKGDPDSVDEAKRALSEKLEANYIYANVKDSATHEVVDPKAITGDLLLPNQSTLGVDGKDYKVEYRASSDAFETNGFAAVSYRPLPNSQQTSADITVKVTDKSNEQIVAEKTLSFSLVPLDQSDINRERELMSAAKDAYAAAIANGQAANAITGNLHAFQKATFSETGSLNWYYDNNSSNAAGDGIVPVDLEGYDSMGTEGWRLFRSSSPAVVSHENLLVTRQTYNAKITVDSRLSSEKYARYAQRYPDNPVFQELSNQSVSATFTVLGTSGQEDPHVSATCSVIGVDRSGAQQTWAAAQSYTLDAGATAADLAEKLFAGTGIEAQFNPNGAYGWQLDSITSPFDAGLTLEWGTFPGKGWSYYVNGKMPDVGAGTYVLQPNDSVVWRYGAWDDPAPTDQLSVSCEIVGKNKKGEAQTWVSPTTLEAEAGSTAADLSVQLFAAAGIEASYDPSGAYGWMLDSITSPFEEGLTLRYDKDTGAYWQLFINGEYALTGAGGYVLQAGDTVSWVYGSDGVMPGQVATTAQIIGMDDNGNTQVWSRTSSFTMLEGATAADLSEQLFASKGIKASYNPNSAYGWQLNSVTSPFDEKLTLSNENAAPWHYWRLFVNGVSSDYGAGSVVLRPGDDVTWCYSTYGTELPNPDDLVIVPDAPRPSYDTSWPGFANGMTGGMINAPTPTESAELSWSYDFREGDAYASASDPLIVNGRIYLVVAGELRVVNAVTGVVERRANVGSKSTYFNRPVYAGGIVIVPSDDGSLAAFTADTLTCVWKTKALEVGEGGGFQSLSSLTVADPYVYAGFTVAGQGEATDRGVLVCVDVRNGRVVWTKDERATSNSSMGYYWAGAAVSGSAIIIGDDAGRVRLLDGSSGDVLSSVDVGAPVRTGVIAVPSDAARAATSETFVVVTRDGTLHKIERSGDELRKVGSVSFSSKSTSTPAVVGGKAFVGAIDEDGYGTLSVIDLATMTVERTVRGGQGEAQGSPLVSVQGDGVYVYFTCNGRPGGVYGYKLGDDSAYVLYAPPSSQQQFSTASIIADGEGNLYYTNDSGTLFALKGAESAAVTFETGGGSYVAPYRAAIGKPLVRPSDPTREGYTFAGWFVDEGCTKTWDFDAPVTGSMTLYAKWDKEQSGNDGQGGGASGGSGGTGSGEPQQNSAPYTKPLLASGSPAAAHAPLTQEVAKADDGKQATEQKSEQTADVSIRSENRAKATAGVDADEGTGEQRDDVNPWAMGGVALGVIGLIGATVYVVRARRRNGEVL